MTQCGATASFSPAYLMELTFKDNLVCSTQCISRRATAATACSTKSASLKAIYASVVGTFSDSVAMRCDSAYQFTCANTKTVPDIPKWQAELTYVKEQCGVTETSSDTYFDHGKACSDACRTKVQSLAGVCAANTITDAAAARALGFLVDDLEMRCDAAYSFNCKSGGGKFNILPRTERNIVQDLCGLPRPDRSNAAADPAKACSIQCKIRASRFENACKTGFNVVIDASLYTPTVAALAAVQCPGQGTTVAPTGMPPAPGSLEFGEIPQGSTEFGSMEFMASGESGMGADESSEAMTGLGTDGSSEAMMGGSDTEPFGSSEGGIPELPVTESN
jgi:hypothetical protein